MCTPIKSILKFLLLCCFCLSPCMLTSCKSPEEKLLEQWNSLNLAEYMKCTSWAASFNARNTGAKITYFDGSWSNFLEKLELPSEEISITLLPYLEGSEQDIIPLDTELSVQMMPRKGMIAVLEFGEFARLPGSWNLPGPPTYICGYRENGWVFLRKIEDPIPEPDLLTQIQGGMFGGMARGIMSDQMIHEQFDNALGELVQVTNEDDENGFTVFKFSRIYVSEAPGRSWLVVLDSQSRVIMMTRSNGEDRKCFYPEKGPLWTPCADFDALTSATDGLMLSANGEQILAAYNSTGGEATVADYFTEPAFSNSEWFTLNPDESLEPEWENFCTWWHTQAESSSESE